VVKQKPAEDEVRTGFYGTQAANRLRRFYRLLNASYFFSKLFFLLISSAIVFD